jgi:hypothetical protein
MLYGEEMVVFDGLLVAEAEVVLDDTVDKGCVNKSTHTKE